MGEERRPLVLCCAEGGNRSFCFFLQPRIRVHLCSSTANLPRLFLTATGLLGVSSALIRRIRSIRGSFFRPRSSRPYFFAPLREAFSRRSGSMVSRQGVKERLRLLLPAVDLFLALHRLQRHQYSEDDAEQHDPPGEARLELASLREKRREGRDEARRTREA